MNKTYLIDLDGTMYKGTAIIEGAKEFINYLIENKISFVFLTNNASRTRKQAKEHMLTLGFKGIEEHHFFTSAMAASKYVKKHYLGNKAYYVGMEGMREALVDEGFEITESNAQFVFIGLDRQGTYEKYSKAFANLHEDVLLIGTNNDRVLMQEDGKHLGNGSIVAMFEYASEKEALKIGKPSIIIVNECLAFYNLKREDCIIIGDNLETDIKCGNNANIETILVESGVHSSSDIAKYHIYPTICIKSLYELIKKEQ